ncbi:MAG: glycosyl hydrolase family 28 protein [Bacteroidota bacterium]|nr:glycosyl hydrolase family 28 protein [Bacteroidota bacterium]
MKRTLVFLLTTCLLVTTGYAQGQQTIFNVLDYGAKGDGTTLDSPAFQKAIDAASNANTGAQVLVPSGKKYLLGTILLKSNIDFHLEGNAELLISTNKNNFIEDALILAKGANKLKISGTGVINGRDMEFYTHYDSTDEWYINKEWRPKLFILTRCTNLEIKDITFGWAPFWGLHLLGCENVVINNLKVRNNLQVPNCDGIDPDHCRNVTITNCHIVSGDDCIVVKATRQSEDYGPSANIKVSDCVLETQDSGVKIGTETTQDIHDITFERCKIITSSRGICIQLRDEGNVYNVLFKDIDFVSRYYSAPWWGRGEGISLTAIPRTAETKLGRIHDVTIKNVKGFSENSIRINGTKESRISDIKLDNVDITMVKNSKYSGEVYDNRPTKVYTPLEKHKTAGFFIRYADNVLLKNCKVWWSSLSPSYFSHALEAEFSTGIRYENLKGQSAFPSQIETVLIKK